MQLRATAFGGVMNNGDEGNEITLDLATGMIFFVKKGITKIAHISACDWLELDDVPPIPAQVTAPKK